TAAPPSRNLADPAGYPGRWFCVGPAVPDRRGAWSPSTSRRQIPSKNLRLDRGVPPRGAGSAALVLRRPALRERGEALVAVLGEQRALVALALDLERFGERATIAALDRALRHGDRDRCAREQILEDRVGRGA